jgi:hypothetical protein
MTLLFVLCVHPPPPPPPPPFDGRRDRRSPVNVIVIETAAAEIYVAQSDRTIGGAAHHVTGRTRDEQRSRDF